MDKGQKTCGQRQRLDVGYYKAKGILRADDGDALRTIADICELFGTEPAMQSGRPAAMAPIPGKTDIALWFPREVNSGDWINVVLDNGDTFEEININDAMKGETDLRQRVTFFHQEDINAYRFLGVYEVDVDETQKQGKYIRRRIAKEYKL